MEECDPCEVPMQAKLKLSQKSESPRVDATEYRSLVRSLRYVVNTRPDLAFSVGYVSRFMEEPHEEHLAVVKHILRYIAWTSDLGLKYARKKGDETLLLGFSDSDPAGDVDSRKSTSKVIFFLGDSPISWQSAKQKVVALSSCEAEYIAAATAACQAVWMARLLAEILNTVVSRPVLRVDNKSTISLVKNPVHHDRSKHIDTRFHLIRDYAQNGHIEVKFIRTDEQLGDVLTKPLCKTKF
ncbi:secreted RxLR effector protein 161-like [Setaria viridis]|uniref:secreted RxLR effector protein 161-like n=1 Tax=Setaria viridis TaxID=4556 RepID=UPI001493CDBF|nr:secreted RxLR effector protein 161-like [Setaria viridis]